MAIVSATGTTANLPNFVGELFDVRNPDTPLLTVMGGLNSGRVTNSKQFGIQTTAGEDEDIVGKAEGASFGTDIEVVREDVQQVVQIFQEQFQITWTKMADVATVTPGSQSFLGDQPVQDEFTFQLNQKLDKIRRSINKAFWQSTVSLTGTREMRGIDELIASNINALSGTPDLALAHLNDLITTMDGNNAPIRPGYVLAMGIFQRQKLSQAFGVAPQSRNVGGVALDTILIDGIGSVSVLTDRFCPAGKVFLLDMSVLRPVVMPIPGKGELFVEPLAVSTASSRWGLYGEWGLDHGPELFHGKITGLSTS